MRQPRDLSFANIGLFRLPSPAVQQRVSERWVRPSAIRFFRPGRLDAAGSRSRVPRPAYRVLIQPARGYNLDPKATYHEPGTGAAALYLAAYAWITGSSGPMR